MAIRTRVNTRNSQKTIRTVNIGREGTTINSYFGIVNANSTLLRAATLADTVTIIPGSGISIVGSNSNNSLIISNTSVISNNSVTLAQIQNISANTLLGRATANTGSIEQLTIANTKSMLGLVSSSVAGRLARFTDTIGTIGSTTGLFEDNSGNIGIGTTSPTTTLDVNGSIKSNFLLLSAQATAPLSLAVPIGAMFERPASSSLNSTNFKLTVNQNPFVDGSGVGGENYANEVTAIGWNLSDTIGNAASTGTAAFWDNWEYKYNAGSKYYHERHMESIDTSGVRHRFFSYLIPHDGGTGSSLGQWVDTIAWSDFAAAGVCVQWNILNRNADFGTASNAYQLRFAKNDTAPFVQRNGANSSFLDLPFYNSDNRLVVGGQILNNATAPTGGAAGHEFNFSGAPGNGSALFAITASTYAANTTLTGLSFMASTNWDFINIARNLRSATQYSSAIWSAQSDSSNGMAYLRCGYTSGQQWSIGMRNTQNFVLSGASNLLSSQVFVVDKTNLNVAFDRPVKLPSYTVAGVPSASTYGAGSMLFVSNESGGATPAFSDGTNWRRVGDRAVIS